MDGQHFGRTRRDAPVRQPLRILRLGKRLVYPEPIESESGDPNEQCTTQSLDTLKRWDKRRSRAYLSLELDTERDGSSLRP